MNISMRIYGSVLEARCWGLDPATGKKCFDKTDDLIRENIEEIDLPEDAYWEYMGMQIKMDTVVIVMDQGKGVELDRFLLEEIDSQSRVTSCPIPKNQFHLFHCSWKKGGADYRWKDSPDYRRDLLSFGGVGVGLDGGLGVITSIQLGDDEQYSDDIWGIESEFGFWVE